MPKSEKDPGPPGSPWPMLLASASAGMVARVTCHPLDTCKAILQVQAKNKCGAGAINSRVYSNFLQVIKGTVKKEGLAGLYRGFGVAFVGGAPGLCLYLSAYEKTKAGLNSRYEFFEKYPAASHFVSGMVAEAFSCVLFVPVDIAKERLQIQGPSNGAFVGGPKYQGNVDAVRQIWKLEGIRGVYKGYGATLMSFGPFSAFYFVFYEQMKKKSLQLRGVDSVDDLPFFQHMANSVFAGMAASFVTNPLDLVKLRLQVQRGGNAVPSGAKGVSGLPWGAPYRNLFHGLGQIVKVEGAPALFKGVGARMAFHGSATAISMACYESFQTYFKPIFEAKQSDE